MTIPHPVDLPDIDTATALVLLRRARQRMGPAASYHYLGCWREHLACAVAEIERLTKELEALRHEHGIS